MAPTTDQRLLPTTAASQSDEFVAITREVQAELGPRIRDFEIVGRPRGLVIRGRTSTYYAKQLVQHLVMRLSRQPILANEIDVS
jgi:hypothetical protein